MSSLPEWLNDAFRQFPVAALVMASAWLAARWVDAKYRKDLDWCRKELEDTRRRADGEIARTRIDKERVEAALAAERAKFDRVRSEQLRHLRAERRSESGE